MGRDQKIKVCHIISGDLWAGAEIQAYILLRTLSAEPDLCLSTVVLNEGTLAEKLRESGIEVTVVDESRNGFFRILSAVANHLKGRQIDIIHSHRRKENVLAGLLKGKGISRHLVQTVHGSREPFMGIKRVKEAVYAVINMHYTRGSFDRVLPVSYDIERTLAGKVERSQLRTVHNSVDLNELRTSRSAAEVRKEFGMAEDRPILGTAGRMVPIKGFDVFLKAAAVIHGQRPDVNFLLAGDGPLMTQLKRMAESMNIHRQVRFPGFRDDLPDIINALDLFVVSSHHEGIPTVVLEAMALGRPVVATNVGGMPEIIEHETSGLLVSPGDSEGLARACLRIMDDSALREKLAAAARQRVTEEFSATQQAGRVAEVYRELAGG
ncbi:MAG: glycosyltransferase family 4 protein [Candidatus Zixiibacteriota bacterium]|nr:MAG: glycosyltransferase family 4 protein [candidate division Zixibacteria bacterium]